MRDASTTADPARMPSACRPMTARPDALAGCTGHRRVPQVHAGVVSSPCPLTKVSPRSLTSVIARAGDPRPTAALRRRRRGRRRRRRCVVRELADPQLGDESSECDTTMTWLRSAAARMSRASGGEQVGVQRGLRLVEHEQRRRVDGQQGGDRAAGSAGCRRTARHSRAGAACRAGAGRRRSGRPRRSTSRIAPSKASATARSSTERPFSRIVCSAAARSCPSSESTGVRVPTCACRAGAAASARKES